MRNRAAGDQAWDPFSHALLTRASTTSRILSSLRRGSFATASAGRLGSNPRQKVVFHAATPGQEECLAAAHAAASATQGHGMRHAEAAWIGCHGGDSERGPRHVAAESSRSHSCGSTTAPKGLPGRLTCGRTVIPPLRACKGRPDG